MAASLLTNCNTGFFLMSYEQWVQCKHSYCTTDHHLMTKSCQNSNIANPKFLTSFAIRSLHLIPLKAMSHYLNYTAPYIFQRARTFKCL